MQVTIEGALIKARVRGDRSWSSKCGNTSGDKMFAGDSSTTSCSVSLRFSFLLLLTSSVNSLLFVVTAVLVEKPTKDDSTIIAVGDTSAADHVNVDDVCMADIRAEDL
ncbi:unnamed protein product [Parnassius apollo]|uniref:(apollo) hypothetical protein n=1 Tax=Parnassius apollo TaxID=110799 RepID=A0A8S3X3M5_PARAO|nr:unnamed protein product [Parnassius apollo]